jgi:anti-sigma factor RsiW
MKKATPPSDTDLPAWQAQRDALQQLHRDVLAEPVPPALLEAAGIISARQQRQARWIRWSGIAAMFLVAFGAGWVGNAQWAATASGVAMARLPAAREFVHAASVAHAVYVPEKRHPVEVAAAEQQHLIQWLSKRLDKPLKVPDLSAQGYALVGGRLLPGTEGARAQFMFERKDGERVTLYLGSVAGTSSTPGRETAFRYSTDGPVPSFYWVEDGFGYALAAKLSRSELLELASQVHRQL